MINTFWSQTSYTTSIAPLMLILRSVAQALLLLACILLQYISPNIASMFISWDGLLLATVLMVMMNTASFFAPSLWSKSITLLPLLIVDSLIWFLAMAATGEATNPAISYLLVLLCVSAFTLPLLHTAAVLMVMVIAYAVLMYLTPSNHHGMSMAWHLWGMWVLFVINAAIIVWLIARLLSVIRQKDEVINQFKAQTARDEHLIALGTLAGSIAHEIGTPLATIAMLAEDNDEQITQQVQRCKQALNKLRQVNEQQQETTTTEAFLAQLQNDILLIKPQAEIQWRNYESRYVQVTIVLQHAVLALLHNAVDAAKTRVIVNSTVKDKDWLISIEHDGDAIKASLLEQLGLQSILDSKKGGLGLGYYLANASIEQLQGRVEVSNQPGKVITHIILPEIVR